MALFEKHPRFAGAQYRAITESSALTSNLTPEEKQTGTPARLNAALKLLDIRAGAYLDLVDDLALQKGYLTLLSAFADQAWHEFIGIPAWMFPATVDNANANEIKRHVTDWSAEGYNRLRKTEAVSVPVEVTLPAEPLAGPTVFISYSWDSIEHKNWVLEFAKRMTQDCIKVVMDQTDLRLGARAPEFMERSVRDSQRVLVICTPSYKEKFDSRVGGAGYEGNVITGEMVIQEGTRKFIPVLREGDWGTTLPTALVGVNGIDLREDSDDEYRRLIDDLLNPM